jgi:ADP-heptose:LPS heptosyltransferase
MRFLLCRTDRNIGDLVVSLPLMEFLLDRLPDSEIFWILRPATAPILDRVPGIDGVLHSHPAEDVQKLIRYVAPDAFLNLSHRDWINTTAAKRAGVPVRVAIPRGYRQAMDATHRIWAKRSRSGRHESQLILDFLKPFGIDVSGALPPPPRLALAPEERELGAAELRAAARRGPIPGAARQGPVLGIVKRGITGSSPGFHWWKKMTAAAAAAGWAPVALSPPEEGDLPPASMRGLMGRLGACDAVLGVSAGPTHLAAALGVPTLCLMVRGVRHGPVRWAPLGARAAFLQCPGEEDDSGSGMDGIEPGAVLAALERLCGPKDHEGGTTA